MNRQASGMRTCIRRLGNKASGIGNESPKDQNTTQPNESGNPGNEDQKPDNSGNGIQLRE